MRNHVNEYSLKNMGSPDCLANRNPQRCHLSLSFFLRQELIKIQWVGHICFEY